MIDKTARIHLSAKIGAGTKIWGLTQIREGAAIGEECIIGRNVYVDHHVLIGNCVKIQNNALLYWPAQIGDGVFIGPGVILTNDKYPRAVNEDGRLKTVSNWKPKGVIIESGVSIGAGAVILGGIKIGRWSVIGAGAVVTADIPPFSLTVGVPARVVSKVKKCGHREGKCECE